jgi:EmrB/QacA subfamily drug resistance transporter
MERHWKVLVVASTGAFIAFLDATIVNIAFPDIRRSFPDVSLADLSWVLSAYNIVFAALLVPAGRLADLVGRRRMFVGGLLGFTIASLACAAAPSVEVLIAARVVQAIGGAALIPTSLAFVIAEFPVAQRAMAVGLWGAAAAVAAALGPSVGGLLIALSDWRLVFLVNVPIGLAACWAGLRLLTEARQPAGTPLPDFVGVVLLTVAVAALTLGIVKGPEWGWTDPRVLGAFAATVVLLPLFLWRSLRHASPVVELALFRVRSFSVANAGTLILSAGLYGMLLCHVLFLTLVWHDSVLVAGLTMSPAALMGAIVAAPAGRAADRWGQRVVVVPGAALFALGNLWFATALGLTPDFVGEWLPGAVLTGIGGGLAYPSLSSAAVAELPGDRFATGSAINAMARQLGGALGISIVVAILQGTAAGDGSDPFRAGWLFAAAAGATSVVVAAGIGRVRARIVEPSTSDVTASASS